jgi:RHS repeat-associated protein
MSTILATVGLLATPSGPAAAATSHAAATAAGAGGTHDTPSPTSTSSPLSALQSVYATTTIAPNGLHQTELSPVPMNYKDSSGKWQAINNSLTATSGGGWHNTANSVSVQLPPDLSSPVTLANGGTSSIGFTLVGANHAAANEGAVSGSTATYPDALPATTVTEQAVTSGVKESLILAASTAPTTFTWDLALGAGLHASTSGGAIAIDNAGSEVAVIDAPTVTDAAGAVGTASYGLNAAGTAVTLSLDPSWLAAPGRVFPVTVDPTAYFFPEADGCVLNQGAPTTAACYTSDLAVGYSGGDIQRSVVHYAPLSDGFMPVDAQIISAQLSLPVVSLSGSVTVNAYPLSRAYSNSAVTWNSYDGTHSWTTPGGDYSTSPTTSATVPSSGTMTLNVSTALVQSWVDGSGANNGLVLKASNESSGTDLAEFDPQSDSYDHLIVTWSPNVGAAQGEPMVTHTLDDHLSLGVNAANGNLVVHAKDLSINGTGLNEVVDRYYNSEDLSTFVGMGDSWGLGEGSGVYAQVNSDNVTVLLPGGQPAVFMDNGTSWTTPPGINAVLSEPTSGHYSLTFNQTQEVIKFVAAGSCTGGQLPEASVSDRNGETITYNYSASACDPSGEAFLTSVTDTEGRVTTVTNNGYYYDGVDEPSTGNVVRYDVNSSPYLIHSEDTSGNYTYFTYGGSGAELTQIEDPNGDYTLISYDSSGRVSSLTYVTNVGAMTGPTYTFAYTPGTISSPNSGSTTLTDPNSHTTTYYYNSNDIQTKVTDGNGNSQGAAYNADDEPTTLTDAMTPAGASTNTYDTNDNETESQDPANGSDLAATSYTNYAVPSGTLGNVYLPSSGVSPESGCSVYGYDANGNVTNAYTGEASVSGEGEGTNPGCNSTSTYLAHASAGYEGDSGVSCPNAKTGEMCWSKDADGNETNYAYDASGDLASVTPPAPQGPTTYTEDSLSRVQTATNGDGSGGTPSTISVVQSATTNMSTSDVSTQTTTLPHNTVEGDTVIVILGTYPVNPDVSVSSISGGGVSTWHLGKALANTSVGDEEIWYGYANSGGSNSVTVNMSAGTTGIGTVVLELSGVASTSPLDVTGSNSGSSGTTASTPSLTTTAPGDMVIDAANTYQNVTSSPASPWVDYAGPLGGSVSFNPVTIRTAATAGAYSTSWGMISSSAWLTVGIALKANAAGTTPTPGTIAAVQSAATNAGSSGTSSQTTTMPSGTLAGDTLVAIVGTNAVTPVVSVSSVTGGGVTTWQLGKAISSTAVGDEEIWYGTVTSSGSTTVTVNMSSGTAEVATEVIEYTGVNGYMPLVGSGTNSGSTATVSTPSLTTTGSGDIVIDAANADAGVTSSPSSPWVDYAGPLSGGFHGLPVTTQVVATTGSSSTSWSMSSGAQWLTDGIVLRPQPDVSYIGYDAMDRITSILYGGDGYCVYSTGNCITYTYDADGNVVSRTDNTGTTTYTYDSLNRLIDVGNPGGADACSGSSPAGITYTYDGASNLTSSCDGLGTTGYSYDAGNRLTSEVEPGGTSGCAVATHTTETGCTAFSYDNDNHLLVTLFPGGATQTSTWAANGKLASIVGANSSATTETSFVYTYASGTQDEDLVQTRVENDPSVSSATTVTYGYNLGNQLTSAVTTGGSSSTLDYYYDAAGNRCSAAASGTPALCPTGVGEYASNAAGELITSPSGSYTYDAAGNQISTPQLSNLAYNLKSQTSSVTPSGGSPITSTYSNNGQDERTSDGSTTLVSGIFGVDQSTAGGTTTYFIRTDTGAVIGEHVGSTSYYYLHDSLGSVVGVISAAGAVEDRTAYDPYGNVTSSSGTVSNPLGYAGGYTDSVTGLIQFGARYYNPTTGGFTQEDPSGQSAGYLYVGDSPVNGTDPSGLICWGLCTITNAAEAVGSALTTALGGSRCIEQSVAVGTVAGAGAGVGTSFTGPGGLVVGAATGGVTAVGTDIFCVLGFT